jgi:hypothetical protein
VEPDGKKSIHSMDLSLTSTNANGKPDWIAAVSRGPELTPALRLT